jgi:hypothetical protein
MKLKLEHVAPAAVLWGILAFWGAAWAVGAEKSQSPEKPSDTKQEQVSTKPGFETFDLLLKRNIFDPARRPNMPERSERPVYVAPPRKEYLALLGVLICGGQAVAFFEDTAGGSGKQVRTGDEIAGFRVVGVATDRIRLEKAKQEQELPVGWQLVRQGETDWRISSEAPQMDGAQVASSSDSRDTRDSRDSRDSRDFGSFRDSRRGGWMDRRSNGTSAGSRGGQATSVNTEEILKRMMERRRLEGGQ